MISKGIFSIETRRAHNPKSRGRANSSKIGMATYWILINLKYLKGFRSRRCNQFQKNQKKPFCIKPHQPGPWLTERFRRTPSNYC